MGDSKKCTKCDVEKDIEEFSKASRGLFKRQPKCKECVKEYYQAHKEIIKDRASKYNYDNKEKVAAYQKEYRN